ncbi:sigma factor-binding protein Crl [Xenorhabdus szentirmaii]|uniref:Sigma factor-binding protein Crl n=2 Tax=Xenorhabdus szentirmaii TaxID=290112 RepID=W1IVC6_9GAMM|nr:MULTISPECIES: sigma factor-binding protein Crl [Xenorhabdus]MBD2781114.1 sigma factor-binding protein Crl [Xenorhabdus sp. 38]MBD2792342.1 sigma factor-binding protein Crl [Xenorhabdus sp. CUL]MBD2802191.1 sigma factor-binding protein Crl [Xenorhabdus sp. M]MBD2806060.1 sigma factor-binding protein Crl [Xenorhabdus sp. ZM]MBD2820954.1 sigma factor-binding protein Crl [Xenorhabdus sp. 42]
MALPASYSKNKLLKRFSALGPYVRELKCENGYFFFDCLAVCVNAKVAPEKREFWGWWLELEEKGNEFVYKYQIGLFDKHGEWRVMNIKKASDLEHLESTLQAFHKRLNDSFNTLKLTLTPSENTIAFQTPVGA